MDYIRYFQQYEDYFWRKSVTNNDFGADEFIYELPDETTISYSNYVLGVLLFLSDESIPPFGSLLLAIIATNSNSEAALFKVNEYVKAKEKTFQFKNHRLHKADDAFKFLKILESLPEIYKTGNNRILLFKTIFDQCQNQISKDVAKKIIKDFKANQSTYIHSDTIPFNEFNFVNNFRTIGLLIHKFPDKETIINALKALPETLSVEKEIKEEILKPSESLKGLDFVEKLIEEDKTFQVGSLMQRIWSGLNIPFHHNVPSQQPIGGVSDLTNKGDFDKLLLSEFANDELVFMSRLANNEALYIQREVPPQDNKKVRVLLIDVSLKNWGNPKTIAFATALAIAKHPKTDIECQLIAFGNHYLPLKTESVSQVIDGLQQLSGALDGAKGLEAYFEQEYKNHKEVELFIFTPEENFESIHFTKVFNDYYEKINFVVTTDSFGTIDIYKLKNKSRKHVKKIKLPLEELWNKSIDAPNRFFKTKIQGEVPILYPVERHYQNIFLHEETYYMYLNSNLFAFNSDAFSKGLTIIANNIQFTTGQYAMLKNKSSSLVLFLWEAQKELLTFYDLEQKTYESKTITINSHSDLKFFSLHNTLFFKDDTTIWKLNEHYIPVLTSNEEIKEKTLLYLENRLNFNYNFKHSNTTYSVLKRLRYVAVNVNNEYLHINNFKLEFSKFVKRERNVFSPTNINFEDKVSLFLKKIGNNKPKIASYFLNELNFTKTELYNLETNGLVIRENLTRAEAEKIKIDLENLGAVCYTEVTHFVSNDGSSISTNNGILELISSNTSIPKIYIPFVLDFETALATDEEYAGNDYFLPDDSTLKNIEVEEFHEKYLEPFIQHILKNEVSTTTS